MIKDQWGERNEMLTTFATDQVHVIEGGAGREEEEEDSEESE